MKLKHTQVLTNSVVKNLDTNNRVSSGHTTTNKETKNYGDTIQSKNYNCYYISIYVILGINVKAFLYFRINNCVGEFNQKFFIQFLFYVGMYENVSLFSTV